MAFAPSGVCPTAETTGLLATETVKQSASNKRIRLALLVSGIAALVLGVVAGIGFGLWSFQASMAFGGSTIWAFAADKLCMSVGSLLGGTIAGTQLLWMRTVYGDQRASSASQ